MIEISKENQKRDQKMSINKFQEIEQDIGERSWVGEGPKIGKYTQKFWFEKKKKNVCILPFFPRGNRGERDQRGAQMARM